MGARLIEGVQESHTNLQFVLAYYGGRHAADLFDRTLTNEKSHIESHRVFAAYGTCRYILCRAYCD